VRGGKARERKGWVNISRVRSVVSGPKFTKFSSPNVGGSAVDNAVFRLLKSSSVPGILAIEV